MFSFLFNKFNLKIKKINIYQIYKESLPEIKMFDYITNSSIHY